jgi:hypothetical protein
VVVKQKDLGAVVHDVARHVDTQVHAALRVKKAEAQAQAQLRASAPAQK